MSRNRNPAPSRPATVERGHVGSGRAGTPGQTHIDAPGNRVTAADTQYIGATVSGEDDELAIVTINSTGQQAINGAGADLNYGDVVVLQTDGTVTTTTTPQDTRPVGIVQLGGADGAPVQVVFSGYVAQVNVTASVTSGNYAETSTTAGDATENASRRAGSFAQYLSSGTTPSALLFGIPDTTSGGTGGSGGTAWFSVTDYGATGDGTTDDTAAIQAALDAACTAGGGVVYFPAGSYKVTGITISCGSLELRGDGKASLIRMASAAGDTITVDATAQRQFVAIRDLRFAPTVTRTADAEITAENFLNLTLENLSFSGAGGQINSCIDLGTTSRSNYVVFTRNIHADAFNRFFYAVRVVECQASQMFTDATTAGVSSIIIEGGCEALLWSQCDFVNSANSDTVGTGTCLTIRASDYSTAPPRFNTFNSCFFDSHEYGLVADAGHAITFNDCWFSDRPGRGALVNNAACDSFIFIGCRFENCGLEGLLLNLGTNHQVIGCEAVSNDTLGTSHAGFHVGVVTGVQFIGNRAYNRTSFGGEQTYGLAFTSGATDYLVLSGNDFSGNLTGTISNLSGVTGTHRWQGGEASDTGWSATTFWRGDGTWAVPSSAPTAAQVRDAGRWEPTVDDGTDTLIFDNHTVVMDWTTS